MRWTEHSALQLSINAHPYHVLARAPSETGTVQCDIVDDHTPLGLFTFTLDLEGKLTGLRQTADVPPHPTLGQVRAALESVEGAQWRALVAKALNDREAELVAQRDAALRTADDSARALQRTRAQVAAARCEEPALRAVAARLAADWEGTPEHLMDTARTALR
jgi:hypothetical protein